MKNIPEHDPEKWEPVFRRDKRQRFVDVA